MADDREHGGKFKKGHSVRGGRKKGSGNKVTTAAREAIMSSLDWDEFRIRLAAIDDPAKYCAIVLRMLEFVAPKMKSVEHTGDSPLIVNLPEMSIQQLQKFVYDETDSGAEGSD